MNIYHDAEHHVEVADVRVEGSPRVGYIPGSGDKVAESLASIGITPTMLSTGGSVQWGSFSIRRYCCRCARVRGTRRYSDSQRPPIKLRETRRGH